MSKPLGGSKTQQGAALLLFFLLLFVGAAGLVLRHLNTAGSGTDKQARAERALNGAKDALIEYAINYADIYGPTSAGPGHLPCPDSNGDGVADASCGPNSIGFLPRKLASVAYEFSADRTMPIWYAVADTFKYNPSVKVNSETVGSLTLDGTSDIAAVLIWPGDPLPGQTTPSTTATNYLEGENADGDALFSTLRTSTSNDIVIPIRRSEIMSIVEHRVLQRFHDLTRDYENACGMFPFAVPYANPRTVAAFDSVTGIELGLFPIDQAAPHHWDSGCAAGIAPEAWIRANNWHHLVYFAACASGSACLDVDGASRHAAVLLAGAPLTGQIRNSSSTLADYFEDENADGASPFTATAAAAINDLVRSID